MLMGAWLKLMEDCLGVWGRSGVLIARVGQISGTKDL